MDKELKDRITKICHDRFGLTITVEDGIDDVFGGSLAVATYTTQAPDSVTDVVFIDSTGQPTVFDTTQELVMFLRQRNRYQGFSAFIESKLFHGLIFILLLVFVFWAGLNHAFDKNALAILGSVVGLAAGLFFSAGKKQ